MTQWLSGGAAATLTEMLDERQHLLEVGLRIFNSTVTADRIVEETYRRWYAIDDDTRAAIPVPRAWLIRTAGEICLELLPAAAVRQASASSQKPAPTTSVSASHRHDASRLPPLHQASGLDKRPQERPTHLPKLAEQMLDRHANVVRRFAAACEAGDAAALEALLAPDAEVVIDGGGRLRAAVRPIHGASAAAEHVVSLLTGQPCRVERVNDRAGLVLRQAGQPVGVVSLNIAGGEVTTVWVVLNPDKLRNWRTIREQPQINGSVDGQRQA